MADEPAGSSPEIREPSPAASQPPASTDADADADANAKKKKNYKPKVSGFIQVFYKARVDAEDAGNSVEPDLFRVQRARIEVKGDIDKHVGYDLEVDPRAPQVERLLRDAFISLKKIPYLPHHEIRIGQQKTQFGYENPESSTRLFTVNRSEVSENLSRGITLRDIGLGLLGHFNLGGGFRFEDAITFVNGAGMNVQADDTSGKDVWGRIGMRYKQKDGDFMVRFGVSGGLGDQTEPDDPGPPPVPAFVFDFERVGVDLEIDHTWAWFATEFVHGRDESTDNPGATGDKNGWYLLLAAKTPWEVGPLVRYDVFEDFRRWTLGAYYHLPDQRLRLLFNYEVFWDDTGRHDDRLYVWIQVRF